MGLCTLPTPPRYKLVLYFLLLPNTRRLLLQFVHHQKLQLPLHDQHTWNRNFHFLPSPHTEHLFISLKHRVAFRAKTEEGPETVILCISIYKTVMTRRIFLTVNRRTATTVWSGLHRTLQPIHFNEAE